MLRGVHALFCLRLFARQGTWDFFLLPSGMRAVRVSDTIKPEKTPWHQTTSKFITIHLISGMHMLRAEIESAVARIGNSRNTRALSVGRVATGRDRQRSTAKHLTSIHHPPDLVFSTAHWPANREKRCVISVLTRTRTSMKHQNLPIPRLRPQFGGVHVCSDWHLGPGTSAVESQTIRP